MSQPTGKHIHFATGLRCVAAADLHTSLSATAVTILKNTKTRELDLRKTDDSYSFESMLKSKDKAFVLFYASWCPFCQRFFPTFEKFAEGKTRNCLSVETNGKPALCERYSIDVVPTVIFFKNGEAAKRLDGVPGVGLDEKQLLDFGSKC